MDNGYKLTTHGREAIAACGALEKALTITRVEIGSGLPSEGADIADIHELIEPVIEGEIGERTHDGGTLQMTVQYRTSEHPNQDAFYLSEFMIYALSPETGEETDLLYASLGDYRQLVPAYSTSLPASLFSFPISIVVSDEIEVTVEATPGVVTHDDLQRLLNQGVINNTRSTVIIPAEGWQSAESDPDDTTLKDGMVYIDIADAAISESMTPFLTILPEYQEIAWECGFYSSCRTMDGVIRLYSTTAPAEQMVASLALIGGSGYVGTAAEEGEAAASENETTTSEKEVTE